MTIPNSVLSKYATINSDPAQKLITAVKDYYDNTYKGKSVDVYINNGVLNVRFENDGKKKSVGWRMDANKAATFEYLDKMFEQAEYAHSEVNRNEVERSAVPRFHYLVTNAKIEGRNIPVKLQVRDITDDAGTKTHYYTHALLEKNRKNDSPSAGINANIAGNAYTPSINSKVPQYPQNVNIQQAQPTTPNILNRLLNGDDVSVEEINTMPQVAQARATIGQYAPTSEINTPERAQLRQAVLIQLQNMGSATIDSGGKVTYNGTIEQGRRADIVIGLPAAGKSSVLAEPLSYQYKSRIIDSDMAKELLPEFNNGLGANRVHQESKGVAAEWLSRTMQNGDNIVYPIVGSDLRKVLRTIDEFKHRGYSVNLHLNELPNSKAVGRATQRFIDTGRFVDPELVMRYGNKPTQVYNAIRQMEGYIDGFSRYSNDVRKGESPILLEISQLSTGADRQPRPKTLPNDPGDVRRRPHVGTNPQEGTSPTEQTQINASALSGGGVSFTQNPQNTTTPSARRVMEIAEKFGVTVVFEDGGNSNGRYQDGTIYINKNSKTPVKDTFIHELTHHLESSGLYNDFQNIVMDSELFHAALAKDGVTLAEYAQNIKNSYAQKRHSFK